MKRSTSAVLFTALVVVAALVTPAATERANAKESVSAADKDIHELLDVTGSVKLAEQVIDGLSQSFGANNPKIPKAFWPEMRKRVKKDELYALIVPVYRKHLGGEDIKSLLAFYKTPVGQRVVKAMPNIAQESMVAGQAWGQKIAAEIAAEIQKRGYDK